MFKRNKTKLKLIIESTLKSKVEKSAFSLALMSALSVPIASEL